MIALYAALGVNYIVAGAEAGFLSEGSKRAIGLAQSAIARSHEQSPVPELATAAKALY